MAKERTVFYSSLSGIIGGLIDYYFNIPIAPILFGLGILLANHSQIKLKTKLTAYFLAGIFAMIIFLFGGPLMSWIGLLLTSFISEALCIYIGSGLCALAIALVFSELLKNFKSSIYKTIILFSLGGLSVLFFFVIQGLPIDRLYTGIRIDEHFYLLFFLWQVLVGFGIALHVENETST